MSNNPSRAPTRAQTAARDVGGERHGSLATRSRPPPSRTQSRSFHKADYRPMVTVARRRSNTRSSRASTNPPGARSTTNPDQLGTIDEGESDTDSIITTLTSDIPKPRYIYNPPMDSYVATEMGIITSYLEETHVNDTMLSLCQSLLSNVNLPYNPYPGFLKRLTHLAEGFHMYAETEDKIKASLQNILQKTSTPVIWGVKGHVNVWGLKDMVHVVDPLIMRDYAWLHSGMAPPKLAEVEESDVKGEILVALTGPAVFTSTFYTNPPSMDFSLEFMMYGSSLDMALKVFAKTLREDVKRTVSSKCSHQFIGMTVIASDGRTTLWDKKKIEMERDGFFAAVDQAVRRRQPPTMRCIFAMDPGLTVYKKGIKKYVFHFIETDKNTGEEQFTSFGEHPYVTLFNGIFLKKADAEAYVAAFKRHQDPSGRAVTRAPSTRAGTTSRGETARNPSFTRRGRREEQPQKQPNVGVIGDDIKEPIRQDWEKELASLNLLKGDALRIVHLMLLVILMDRNKYSIEEVLDIYRFLHSTVADFHASRALCPSLLAFIRQYDNSQQEFASKLFKQYKRDLLRVLDPALHERSSDQCSANNFLKLKLDRLTEVVTDQSGSKVTVLPFGTPTVLQLIQIQHYCDVIQLSLTEDSLAYLKHLNLKDVMTKYQQEYPGEVRRPKTRVAVIPEPKDKKKGAKKPPVRSTPVILRHGVEANSIIQQKSLFVNVEWSVQTSIHPVIMATEGVLMQYLIDVKLDQVWQDFLMDLLNADHLPPNPYPRLLTRFRQAALKVELWREADDKLCTRLLHGEATPVDRTNHVYVIQECSAFGVFSAVSTVLAPSFKKLTVLSESLANKDVVSHKGQFQLSTGLAISGHSPLYGRMMPYLPYLELHEHYYIRGPMGSHGPAIQLFAKLVYDHVADLCSLDRYIIMGLYVDEKLAFNQDQLEEDQHSIVETVAKATSKKQSVWLKLYFAVGWRYVPIHKHYKMHYLYVDNAEDRYQAFFPDEPISLYQNTFLTLEEAVNHFQQCGASVHGNPLSANNVAKVNKYIDGCIRDHLQTRDLILVHKFLMSKALINKNTEYLGDTWRMLHSMAFQIEYINALTQSLYDITRYVLQHPNSIETPKYLEEIAAAKAKAKKGTTVPTKKFPVRTLTLGRMATACKEKVLEVVGEPCSFVPLSLPQLLADKLKNVMERNPQTQELGLVIEKQTIMKLLEIQDLLAPIKAAIEHDVHQACSKVQEALKHIT